ncbi:MAG: hypothetical protein HY553_05640 [Elusimicrobia bacterium]|nr:hypothetical protein [Elusimicrobiota bacterium]
MPEAALKRPFFTAAAGGLLYYLGFSPLSLWPLTFVGVWLLVGLLDDAESSAEAAWRAMAWKALGLMPTVPYLSGLGISVHVVAVGIHVACWGLMGAAFAAARRGNPLAALAALPALWTLAEWLGTVKHFLPSHVTTWSQALAAPALGLAPYTGALGVSTVAVAAASLPAVLLRLRAASGAARRGRAAFAAAAFGALLAPPLAGRLLHGPAPGASSDAPLRVATFALEANDAMEEYLDQGDWTPERSRTVSDYVAARVRKFRTLVQGMKPDLLVLPEDAVDLVLPRSRSEEAFARLGIENNGVLIEAYRELARSTGADLATGITTIREGRRYNSTLLVGRDGGLLGIRDKWKLTPGSEYWPAPAWLPVWALFSGDRQYVDPRQQYSAPSDPFPPLTLGGRRLGASTCLEGHMPTMYLGWRRAGAELLLFLGNAHWFHWDPATFNVQLLRTVRLSAAAYALPVIMTGKANNAGAIAAGGAFRVWPWVADGGTERAHEVLVHAAPPWRTTAVRWGEYYLPYSAAYLAALLLAARLLRKLLGLRG